MREINNLITTVRYKVKSNGYIKRTKKIEWLEESMER